MKRWFCFLVSGATIMMILAMLVGQQPTKKPTVSPKKVSAKKRKPRIVSAPVSMRAVVKVSRLTKKPQRISSSAALQDLAMRTISIPLSFRPYLDQAELQMVLAASNLSAWQETRWRVDTLERELLPLATKAQLTPWRFSQLVLRGFPPPSISGELSSILTPLGGEGIPQRILRMGLTRRKETLAEVLNWFPEIRDTLLQRLQALGSQLVGGSLAVTGAEGLAGGAGAPTGIAGAGGGAAAPAAVGLAGAVGVSGPSAPSAPSPGVGGLPSGLPSAVGAAISGGATSNFYRYLWLARNKMIEPEYAAIFVLALQAYREQVDAQIRIASAFARRAKEEWAELKELIVQELRKTATTPLRQR